ncbi:MAG: metallophosphoesterase [Bacteroidota bacterium]
MPYFLIFAQKYGSFIFVSGHEHSLQYHQDKGQHFIVSGAGSKATATAATNKTMFSYGNLGFSKIDVYEDGSAWVEFWVPEENSALGKRVYRYKMKDALKAPKPAEIPTSFPEYDQKLSSKTVFPIKTQVKQTKKTETFMLGHHYRNIYLEKYEFPVLDLSTYKGGFRILKKGGGKQTNSLRMINPAGKEYVLRSLTKDVSRTVPYPFNQMPLINYLFIDNFLGTHPFAPLVIGDLADAAKVYHTNPQIYYVPKQPALGSYNDMFGGEVYLFEERPSKSWPDLASFGNAVKFSNSYDLIDKMEKNNKHRVDQKWAARSRIFDVLIGDWDRHEDQWRWTVTQDEGGYKLYRPIPRDRDQAFSKYDGFAIKILSPYNVFLHQISDYDDKMNNFKWNTYNSRHFDNTFLNELDLEDWKNEASYIKEHLTDEVIEDAFKNLPPKVYDLSAEQIMTVLKSRRDKLQIIAEGMYEELAQKVTIVGTEKKDYFEIIRKENGETEINRYDSNKKGEKKERLYHRVFKDSETKSVFIYGLGDDDIFHMSGKADRGFRIHLMGAHGDDTYIDESKVSGAGKKHKIHDTKTGNKLQLGTESKDLTSNVVVNNQYDRHGKQNDENMFFAVPLVGFNGDDGIFIGATTYSQINVFTKNPYGQYHKIGATYAFATKALDIEYNGEFIQIAKKWDLLLNGNIRGDRYAFNFFGLGNETERIEDDINFYRVQQSMGYVDIGFQRRFASDLGRFTLRSSLQGNDIADTENRFIDGDDTGLDEKHFENRLYLGFISSISLASVDNEISPRNGFRFNSELHHRTNLSGSSRQFVTFGTDFTLYQSFGNKRSPITLASRIGTELIRGDYDFFFAPSLGQKQNLRGFPRDRFRGATSMFHTTDLRVPIAASNNPILPMTIGIFGSFDYGRVWEPNEDSGLWHSSFGGGLLLFPLNMFVLSLNVHRSNEDIRFRVSIKHSF